jgi:mannose-6-phosphate isomerase
LCECPYFKLETLYAEKQPIQLDTKGESFHAVTVLEGTARVVTPGGEVKLNRFETAVIPAACGTYRVEPVTAFRALRTGVV